MPSKHDYVPSHDDDLLTFAKTFYAYAFAHYSQWAVPSPQNPLSGDIDAFESLLGAYKEPNHGKVDTLNKNEAKKTLTAALRTYIQGYVARNPTVTDGDREQMGLPLRDTTPTPHPVPGLKPDTEAEPWGKGRHRVTAVNPETGTKKKPALVKGVAFAHRVRNADAPKSRADDMPSEFQVGTERSFQWTEADYGRVADYATAYENEGGKRGQWSYVASVIIA
jgi:hypothetical protein